MSYLKAASLSMNFEEFYIEKELLGKGSMGDVKMCERLKDGKKYAVKIIQKNKQNRKDMELQKREIEALKMCQHPNLIGFYDFFENANLYHIVIEYLSGGDLFDYLERRDFKIDEARAKTITRQICSAVYYLHSYGIVHRDLKLENVMMTNDHDTQSMPKLVDFGLAGIKGPNLKFKDAVGTVSYAAPEVLKGHSYDKSIDIWSIGIIIYVLLIGYLPFDSEDK